MWKTAKLFLLLELSLYTLPGAAQQWSGPLRPAALRFEPYSGQTSAHARYVARGAAYAALFDEAGLTIGTGAHSIRMRFAGSSTPTIRAADETNVRSNYYTDEPNRWRTGVPSFQRLQFKDVYSGIDVVFYGRGRELQFDFVLAPKAGIENVRITFSGQEDLKLTGSNALELRTAAGKMRLSLPGIYQILDGRRRNVKGRFVKRSADTVGIALGDYDRESRLIVDPVVFYSTYLGGEGAQESINDIQVDSAGNAYVTYDDYDDTGPSHDFVVSKISPTGGSGYTTVLGHFHSEETASALAVDASGNAYVIGWAYSYPEGHPRFPSVSALQPLPAGGADAILVKLDPQGRVVFSTYLGGSGDDYGRSIALDSSNNIYVAGTTSSGNFPVRNPYQAARASAGTASPDVFVAKINPSGSVILYSTYLGGADDDSVASIAVDGAGDIYLAGSTRSRTFAGRPIPARSNWSGYALKFNAESAAVIYSFVWSDAREDHLVTHAALDGSGGFYIAESDSVKKLNASGSALEYLISIPGSVAAVAVDAQGSVYATGNAFPAFSPQTSSQPGSDVYVAKISRDGSSFGLVTSLHGTIRDPGDSDSSAGPTVGTAITVAPSGAVYIGGYSESFNFPTTNGSTRSRTTPASTQDAILFVIQPD